MNNGLRSAIIWAINGYALAGVRGDVMDWQTHIVIDPKVLAGKPVIKGTRISVELVIELLARGYSVAEVLEEYDHLTPDDIQACLAYASDLLKAERVYATPKEGPPGDAAFGR